MARRKNGQRKNGKKKTSTPAGARNMDRGRMNSGVFSQPLFSPEPLLGEEMASKEWQGNEKPVDVFIHTESYEAFCRHDILFLFGRRGTGKTSMLRMLQYEVREEQSRKYAYSWNVNQDTAYYDLALHVDSSRFDDASENQLIHVLKEQWCWTINVAAMCAVFWQHQMRTALEAFEAQIAIIRDYLVTEDLIVGGQHDLVGGVHPFKRLVNVLFEEAKDFNEYGIQYAAALKRVWDKLRTPSYAKATAALKKILEESKTFCLVTIDSLETYSLEDRAERCVLAALVSQALVAYSRTAIDRIIVKVAFPSEVFSRLPSVGGGKFKPRCLFIRWGYSDLVSLLAKRFARKIVDPPLTGKPLASLDDVSSAQTFLYEHLPKAIETRQRMQFDTLAYIIRHTQKTFRQLITLMNTVLTYAKHRRISLENLTEKVIVDGVHARLDILIDDALDGTKYEHPKAPTLIPRALANARGVLELPELDRQLSLLHSDVRREGLDSSSLRRLLIAAGALGLLYRVHNGVGPSCSLWECTFQYQVPDTVVDNHGAVYVVHPMFYQTFRILLPEDVFVYPVPNEDIERAVLSERGISIGV